MVSIVSLVLITIMILMVKHLKVIWELMIELTLLVTFWVL